MTSLPQPQNASNQPESSLPIFNRQAGELMQEPIPAFFTPAQEFDDDHLVGFLHVQKTVLVDELNQIDGTYGTEKQTRLRAQLLGNLLLASGMKQKNPLPPIKIPRQPLTKKQIKQAIARPRLEGADGRADRFKRLVQKFEGRADSQGAAKVIELYDRYDNHPVIQAIDAADEHLSKRGEDNMRLMRRAALLIIDASAEQ